MTKEMETLTKSEVDSSELRTGNDEKTKTIESDSNVTEKNWKLGEE